MTTIGKLKTMLEAKKFSLPDQKELIDAINAAQAKLLAEDLTLFRGIIDRVRKRHNPILFFAE